VIVEKHGQKLAVFFNEMKLERRFGAARRQR
jgi:hypothetical protein